MAKYFLRENKGTIEDILIKVFEGGITSKYLYVFAITVDYKTKQINKDFCGKIENNDAEIEEALIYPDLYVEVSGEQVYDILNKTIKDIIF